MINLIAAILLLFTLASYAMAIMEGLTHGHEVQADWWSRVAGMEGCMFVIAFIFICRKLFKEQWN